MKRAGLVGVALSTAFLTTGASAWAGSAIKLCVPKSEGSPALTPRHGKCKKGYTLASLSAEGKQGREGKTGAEGTPGAEGKTGSEGKPGPEGKAGATGFTSGELETLKSILPHIKYSPAGIGGKPTIQFSAVNVQIVNGEGTTASVNGEGNLVIGYDENEFGRKQTGSHDLVLGTEQAFTGFGGIVAGAFNTINGQYTSVLGGSDNVAKGLATSIGGGNENTAENEYSSVAGGASSDAKGAFATVGGGRGSLASGEYSSVSGGEDDSAEAYATSIFGGKDLKAEEKYEYGP